MGLILIPEWEGATIRVYAVGGLPTLRDPRVSGYSNDDRLRRVRGVVLYQAGVDVPPGEEGLEVLARWYASRPTYRDGRVVGGGGDSAMYPHTFAVPDRPDTREGKLAVYRVHADVWTTPHTHPAIDPTTVSVDYLARIPSHRGGLGGYAPSSAGLLAIRELVEDYLLPRYTLSPASILLGCDVGAPTSPGDAIEAWARRLRGEEYRSDDLASYAAPADVAHARLLLARAGYDVGEAPGWSPWCAAALRAWQRASGHVPDGVWGPRAMRALGA